MTSTGSVTVCVAINFIGWNTVPSVMKKPEHFAQAFCNYVYHYIPWVLGIWYCGPVSGVFQTVTFNIFEPELLQPLLDVMVCIIY